MHVFITGIAGFIGFHTAQRLHSQGIRVSGCDTFNTYYDPELKKARAHMLQRSGIHIAKWDIGNLLSHKAFFVEERVTHILHLAAQAGVRHSLSHPTTYISTNINGTFSVLELCKSLSQCALIFASSSSVYGTSQSLPFSEDDPADSPVNLYAATKRSTEHMAHSYHHLYDIPMRGLRYFTAYGPYGRPDMALFLFAEKICAGETIPLFNQGNMRRDFTYIDDIVDGTIAALQCETPWSIYNLGNGNAVSVLELITLLEDRLGKKAKIEMLPMQPGEVEATWADITKANKALGFSPKTALSEGVAHFVEWFLYWKSRST